jgi:hypothetical protein
MRPTAGDKHADIARLSRECRISADAARVAIQRSHEVIAAARDAMERTHATIDRSELALKSAISRVESHSAVLR